MVRYLFILFIIFQCNGASHYVRSGASGDGSDWSNAFADLPATLIRGDTYYMADGNYAGYTFNDAADGTNTITIKKATVTEHGTETGWDSAYGDGQAVFTNACSVNAATANWYVFDGTQGDYFTGVPYGIKILSTKLGEQVFNLDNGGHNSILRYCEIAGPADGTTNDFPFSPETAGLTSWGGATNVLVSHCYIHGCSTLMDGVPYWTIEYCVLRDARSAENMAHSNVYYCAFGAHHIIFRYNSVFNYNDEGFFISGYNGSPHDIYAYGNVFSSPGTRYSRGFAIRKDYNYTNLFIYNNTIVNMTHSGIANNTALSSNSTVNCEVINNLLYNASIDLGDISVQKSNVLSVVNVFYNIGGNDFRPTSQQLGYALSAPYNYDMNGNVRNNWTIGAYEYQNPSRNLKIKMR